MAAAYAARKMGVSATIIVPSSSPELVVQRLQDHGATVKIIGKVVYNTKCSWSLCSSTDLILAVST